MVQWLALVGDAMNQCRLRPLSLHPPAWFVTRLCQAKAEDVSVHMQPLEGTRWRRYVREIRLDWREATGPCRARHLAASLWAGEAHALQIDSHMRFAAGWDAALLDNLQQAEEIAGHHKAGLAHSPALRECMTGAFFERMPIAAWPHIYDCVRECVEGSRTRC